MIWYPPLRPAAVTRFKVIQHFPRFVCSIMQDCWIGADAILRSVSGFVTRGIAIGLIFRAAYIYAPIDECCTSWLRVPWAIGCQWNTNLVYKAIIALRIFGFEKRGSKNLSTDYCSSITTFKTILVSDSLDPNLKHIFVGTGFVNTRCFFFLWFNELRSATFLLYNYGWCTRNN